MEAMESLTLASVWMIWYFDLISSKLTVCYDFCAEGTAKTHSTVKGQKFALGLSQKAHLLSLWYNNRLMGE